MAWAFWVNRAYYTDVDLVGAQSAKRNVVAFKDFLKAQGWSVPSSSDGLTYNSSGDQITHAGTGAGGLANSPNGAWFRLRQPVFGRELLIYGYGATWGMKYSRAAGFTGGSPGAAYTALPTATDEQVVSAPASNNGFTASYNARFFIVAGGAAEQYSFVAWLVPLIYSGRGYNYALGGLALDMMLPGSYHASDADPCVVWMNGSSTSFSDALGSFGADSAGRPFAWFRAGLSGSSFRNVQLLTPTLDRGVDPYDRNAPDQLRRATWVRKHSFAPSLGAYGHGTKGVSTIFYENGIQRGHGQTLTVVSPRDRIVLGDSTPYSWFNVPWNGSKHMLMR